MKNIKLLEVSHQKNRNGRRSPRIHLQGIWLRSIGFSENTVIFGEFTPNSIILKAYGRGIDRSNNFVKELREDNLFISQVTAIKMNTTIVPIIHMAGDILESNGFHIGDVISLRYDDGIMTVKKVDTDIL